MVQVYFYSINSSADRLNKPLNTPVSFSGILNTPIDLLHPHIRVKASNVVNYNYCYISTLNRYYFVDTVRITNDNFYELYLSVDVLMTYKTEILALYGYLLEGTNANEYSNIYIDSYDLRRTKTILEYNNPFNENGTTILIASKGNSAS